MQSIFFPLLRRTFWVCLRPCRPRRILPQEEKNTDSSLLIFISLRYFSYLSVILRVLKNFIVTHTHTHTHIYIYRVIHKSLRDFRPLRYSSRDGHAEGEHVNRKNDTSSFCPTLQVLNMLTSEGSWQTFLAHARQSRPMAPAGLFVSQRTGSHSAGISCTTHKLFYL